MYKYIDYGYLRLVAGRPYPILSADLSILIDGVISSSFLSRNFFFILAVSQ